MSADIYEYYIAFPIKTPTPTNIPLSHRPLLGRSVIRDQAALLFVKCY